MTEVKLGPAVLDLKDVYAGEPNPLQLTLNTGTPPVPIDLTGKTLSATARETLLAPTVALTGVVDITDAENGVLVLSWDGDEIRDLMLAAETETWDGYWDLQIDQGPRTPVAGKFKAKLDVTR